MSVEDTDMADLSMSSLAHIVPSEDEFQSESESATDSSTSSDESDTERVTEEEWTAVDSRVKFSFTGELKINSGSANTPVDYFKLLFNKTFVNLLVSCINMHMVEIISNPASKYYGNELRPTDVEEVYTLLSVYFFMGYVRISEWCYYWETDHLYNLKFDRYMNKDRFSLLVRALAYKKKDSGPDHGGDARRSWYDAAKPLADYFNRLMKTLVFPGKNLNIDKYTAYWFHESNFVCKRPERIRMHLLSDELGIFHRVYLCHPDIKNKGDHVIKSLMSDFFYHGHSLYACPFYTSVSLAEELLDKKTHFTGVLKRKKSRNPMFVRKKLKIGSIKTLYNAKGVCLTNFRKNQTILTLSTEHSGKLVEGKVMLPEMTLYYKNSTNTVLKRNKTLSDNAPQDFTKKYNKNICYLLQVMMINAYTIHNIREDRKSFSDFRREILEHYLPIPKDLEGCDSEDDTDTSFESREDVLDSEVIHLPAKVNKTKKTTRNCRHCWLTRGMRQSTLFYCPQCPQKWGLCIECFRSFHKY